LIVKRPLLLAISVLVTLGCSTSSVPSQSGVGGNEGFGSAIPKCDSIPAISAPESAFRDEPIYVANEMPVDEVRTWAQTKPGYADIWIDRDHGGWITVAFTEDVAAREAELAETFPGVGVVAVQVDRTNAELEALQQRVSDRLMGRFDSMAVASDVRKGVVEVYIGVLSEERIAIVASQFAGEPVCVSGIDPAVAIPVGPQPTGGDGWRLLASEKVGEPYRTGIAAEPEAYASLWASIGLAGEPPPVDLQREVVIWFGAVYGSSCPDIRLDAVVSDQERRLVHGTIVLPSTFSVCTQDANPHAFVVAIERATLPPPPFGIQLSAEDPPGGAPEERTIVEADLRVPGSAPRPGDVHGDPTLPKPDIISSGSTIEPGFEATYRLDVRCGIEWLGRLNDVSWRTDPPPGSDNFIPAAWEPLVEGGALVVSVLMRTDPEPSLTATAAGHTVEYLPTLAPVPDC
jgi:hypothetical protein